MDDWHGRRRRLRRMTDLGHALAVAQGGHAGVHVGVLRRLFAAVVGPGTTSHADVVEVRGGVVTVAARSRHQIERLKGLEGFFLDVIARHFSGPPVRAVRYVVDPAAGGADLAAEAVARMPIPMAVDATTEAEIAGAAARVPDDALRETMARWMRAVTARREGGVA